MSHLHLRFFGSRAGRWLGLRLAAVRERADEGQALVLALIIVLIIGLMPAIILSSLNQEMPYASESVNYESALAAAEAGVQEYANLLDQYPGYQNFAPQAGGATTSNDPGLPGGGNLALGSWAPVAGTNPPEWFTYYPDTSELNQTQSATNPFGGDVLLVVTGRAGLGQTTQYRRIEASFTLSGVLTDVYFSNYEQPGAQDLDQWENTYTKGCTGGCAPVTGTHEFDEATDTTPCAGSNCYTPSEPMATALCQYDADQINNFIDWYSQYVSPVYPQPGYPGFDTHTAYSSTNPYFGPWYGAFPDPTDSAYQFGQAPTSGTRNNGDQSACNTNYWITGDVFNGPVYSQDELTTCGTPSFESTLSTGIPVHFPFPAEKTSGGTLVGWPGQLTPVANPSGSGYVTYPRGWDNDPWNDCGGATPTITGPPAGGVNFGVSQQLPQANQSVVGEIESGQIQGCVYTGPTMIRFTYNTTTGAEVMDVWSPLTKNTYGIGSPDPAPGTETNCGATATGGAGDLCGGTACNTGDTNTQVVSGVVQSTNFAQVPISGPLVIAVQNLPTASSDPNSWSTIPTAESNATVSGCIDPWVDPDSTTSITSVTCSEGDAIVSGAIGAQVTLSSANDIVLARSLVYGCAVNSSGTYQDNLANCQSSANVVGLIALNDIWMSRPYSPTTGQMAADCTDNTDLQASAITWSNMVPNCTVVNPVVDAAMAALNGFFEVEYWREGTAAGGTLYFNGSDAVNNAGQFGTFTAGGGLDSGYLLTLNYDARLKSDPPPQYLPATDGVWQEVGWVTCGSTTPNPFTSGYPNGVPACTSLAGSYAP